MSVSRRTDIPAFYTDWFMQRIRKQYCTTMNPFKGIEVSSVQEVEEIRALCNFMSQQTAAAQIPIYSCAETLDLSSYGILSGKCIDADLIRKLFGIQTTTEKDKSQRQECGCTKSKDIGAYDTCLHGCAYCYAGTLASGLRNLVRHKPDEPALIS